MKTTFTLFLACMGILHVHAQSDNPFSGIGKPGKILTLSHGKYVEIHINDSLQRVGSVIVNMKTGKIHQLLDADSLYNDSMIDPTILTRWYSADPLASKYPGLSPYQFAYNSPNIFIDNDGRDGILTIDKANQTVTLETTVYLYGVSNKEGAILAKSYNESFAVLQNSQRVVDPNDPNRIWNVEINVRYAYDENIASSIENQIDMSGILPTGANTLKIINGIISSGRTQLGANDGWATFGTDPVIHETFHFLGFDERYIASAGLAIAGFETDVLSNGTARQRIEDKTEIRPFHMVDLLDYALQEFPEDGQYYLGTKSCIDVTYSFEEKEVDGVMRRMRIERRTNSFNQFSIDNTNGGIDSARKGEKERVEKVEKERIVK